MNTKLSALSAGALVGMFGDNPKILDSADALALSGSHLKGMDEEAMLVMVNERIDRDGAQLPAGRTLVPGQIIYRKGEVALVGFLYQGNHPDPAILKAIVKEQSSLLGDDRLIRWRLAAQEGRMNLSLLSENGKATIRTDAIAWDFAQGDDRLVVHVLTEGGEIKRVEGLEQYANECNANVIAYQHTGLKEARAFTTITGTKVRVISAARSGGIYQDGLPIQKTLSHTVVAVRYVDSVQKVVYLTSSGWMFWLDVGGSGIAPDATPKKVAEGFRLSNTDHHEMLLVSAPGSQREFIRILGIGTDARLRRIDCHQSLR